MDSRTLLESTRVVQEVPVGGQVVTITYLILRIGDPFLLFLSFVKPSGTLRRKISSLGRMREMVKMSMEGRIILIKCLVISKNTNDNKVIWCSIVAFPPIENSEDLDIALNSQ